MEFGRLKIIAVLCVKSAEKISIFSTSTTGQ